MKTLSSILLVLAALAAPADAQSVTLGTGQGLSFSQVDFTFAGAPLADSSYGMAHLEFASLAQVSGWSSGYLNAVTPQGWVLRNVPFLDPADSDGWSAMFDLGSTGDVTSLLVHAELTQNPVTSFSGTPATTFAVGAVLWNAEGGEDAKVQAPTGAPDLLGLSFLGLMDFLFQPVHPNVEQDVNQCIPAAVANSFQWLEDVYQIQVPHDNVPGMNGDNSLVGQLDQQMKRNPGQPTFYADLLSGKVEYVATSNLSGDVKMKHKNQPGQSWIPNADVQSQNGQAVSYVNNNANQSLIDWIIQEIREGEDVELNIRWLGGGGHAIEVTGAGTILGAKFISFKHDADQGATGGTSILDGGHLFSFVLADEMIQFPGDNGPDKAKLAFATSTSPKSAHLQVMNLTAGMVATISVTRATPGGTVRHGFSLSGGGPVGTPWGSLLLSPPYTELPAMIMNSSGAGSFTGPIPPGTTGLAVWLHALDIGSLTFTNGVSAVIG